ncbi:hypothetical protein BAY61_32330 (plasmid) [Prauserella marina]|uniref:Uncharacterized protein n=1 Tax=Prauserella marina TaxID=530584 RepID=A0A222W1G2_9PSEU|nr:hypothetical protein [Prauserella marina]ASR39970.1 hypothetical protein BAY61_32330 [Prauserella marina]PWV71308.1 hypothetical protein DES30_11224 [Prauserella marina]SDD96867.1 hypothetical protein SAMN05421630_11588 [Prauserella marina]
MAAGVETIPLFPLFGEPVEHDPLPEQPPAVVVSKIGSNGVRPGGPPLLTEPLVVDPVRHTREIERFYAKVIRGPGEHCWIWARGAISDDGYGTFSITRDHVERTVKAHRFAVAYQLGIPVRYGQVVEHVVC